MDTPQTVAAAILHTLQDEPRELLLGAPERLFAKLNALAPSLVDRSLRRQLGVVRRYASRAAGDPVAASPVTLNR
jgi:hypothetical protein